MSADPNHLTEVLTRVRAGESAAVTELVEITHDRITEIVHDKHRRVFGNQHLSDRSATIAHHVVADMVMKQKNFPDSTKYFYSLVAITTFRVIADLLDQRKAQKRGSGSRGEQLSPEEPDHDERARPIDDETLQAIMAIGTTLEASDPETAAVWILKVVHEKEIPEIARDLEIPENQVKAAWERARHHSRDMPEMETIKAAAGWAVKDHDRARPPE